MNRDAGPAGNDAGDLFFGDLIAEKTVFIILVDLRFALGELLFKVGKLSLF